MPATKRLRAVEPSADAAPDTSSPVPTGGRWPDPTPLWDALATAISGSLVTFSLVVAFIFAAFVDSGAADLLQGPALIALGVWFGVRASGRRNPNL